MSGSTQAAPNKREKSMDKMPKHANNLSNNKNAPSHIRQPQGEKIQSLKNQIEKQMKAYVKQEEYEEMLKLIKVNSGLKHNSKLLRNYPKNIVLNLFKHV